MNGCQVKPEHLGPGYHMHLQDQLRQKVGRIPPGSVSGVAI